MGSHARTAEVYSQLSGGKETGVLLLRSAWEKRGCCDFNGPATSLEALDMSRFNGLCRVCSEQRYQQVGASESHVRGKGHAVLGGCSVGA